VAISIIKVKKTLRFRLTAWYVLLLACTLACFSGFLYLQFDKSMLSQLDAALEVAASEILINVVSEDNFPVFQTTQQFKTNKNRLAHAGFAVRLLTEGGEISDGFGDYQTLPLLLPKVKGYQKLTDSSTAWRIYNEPLKSELRDSSHTNIEGWLQVAQSLKPVYRSSERLLVLMLFGFPLMLCLAALGGLFLADRALRPINKIVRTAEAIAPGDFTLRIGNRGTDDEVGRLAMTLDRMLDRLQLGFDREKRFSSDVAHELRTPLTVIKGRIGVTLSRTRSTDEYINTLEDIERETDRLIRLANGLLFLARLEQEQIPTRWHIQDVDLSNILSVLVEQMQHLAELKHISLTENIASELTVQGNGDYLTSLFLNLLDNAIKYTPNGGKVTVKATKVAASKQICISVINTGERIAPEHLPHLFERFYRIEGARSRNNGGDGLGLAIAHEIARLHGGYISVQNQGDREIIFSVCFPN
jgi:heavy metal sensor kinase